MTAITSSHWIEKAQETLVRMLFEEYKENNNVSLEKSEQLSRFVVHAFLHLNEACEDEHDFLKVAEFLQKKTTTLENRVKILYSRITGEKSTLRHDHSSERVSATAISVALDNLRSVQDNILTITELLDVVDVVLDSPGEVNKQSNTQRLCGCDGQHVSGLAHLNSEEGDGGK